MNIFQTIVVVLWLGWLVYWLVSARNVKKDVDQKSWQRFWWLRVIIVVAVAALVGASEAFVHHTWQIAAPSENFLAAAVGAVLVVAGLVFAIWARRHLGRNWSNRPTHKEDHELVTSGPYRLVRHPIYTGILTAVLGSILVGGAPWVIAFFIACIVFIARIPVEERIMTQQFPDQYPAYKKGTKALIPFVW